MGPRKRPPERTVSPSGRFTKRLRQPGEKPAEGAVAENQDDLATRIEVGQVIDDLFHVIGEHPGFPHPDQVLADLLPVEPFLRRSALGPVNRTDDGLVRPGQGLRDLRLETSSYRGVGPGFEDGHQPSVRPSFPGCLNRHSDRRGMVGEVVDEQVSPGLQEDLHSTSNASKQGEDLGQLPSRDFQRSSHSQGGDGVLEIVTTGHGKPELAPFLSAPSDTDPLKAVIVSSELTPPGSIGGKTICGWAPEGRLHQLRRLWPE